MQLSDFDFPFDPNLIADHPVKPRDSARLLVVPRNTGSYSHVHVRDLPTLLSSGDLLVVNDTKVMPARLLGTKVPSGGKVELLVVKPRGESQWEVMIKGKVSPGQSIKLSQSVHVQVVERTPERTIIQMGGTLSMREILEQVGETPLPPYIKRDPMPEDLVDYQTVFARAEGAVAAPTAGLHFTDELLNALASQGIQKVSVTLHVGPGTFRSVTTEDIDQHQMDTEWFEVSPETCLAINQAKANGRRVVAVGTTVVRSLEASCGEEGKLVPQSGETRLFIKPGYQFKVVDAIMTNFHFPRTTLLMLVGAFAGIDQARGAYKQAVKEGYRMYSYGDAMLIH